MKATKPSKKAKKQNSNASAASGNGKGGWLRIADAAACLGFKSDKAIRHAIATGRLAYYKFGRNIFIKPEDLESAMKRISSRSEILG